MSNGGDVVALEHLGQRQCAQAVHPAVLFGCVAQPLRTRAALHRARPARCSAVASSRSV